jgi:CDP-glucose 4,6-dehydratase
MDNTFDEVYKDKTVLVTGHTGFKGSWLSIWLTELGANVIGYSLDKYPTEPCNFELSHVSERITDVRGDTRDFERLKGVIEHYKPQIIFHLAAQPIVLRSYEDPKATFDINSGGTVNVLEAVRATDCVDVLVCITSDKAYRNVEQIWPYRETDALGDEQPYSASKAMAEHAIESYRESFFSGRKEEDRVVGVCSTRAGNVVGGGDFAQYRLVPDCAKALMRGDPIEIRNPISTRPWQLVLEPLSGYLWVGAKLLKEPVGTYSKAWNFGPKETYGVAVGEVANLMVKHWGSGEWKDVGSEKDRKESNLLMLDWSAARKYLGWSPIYAIDETVGEVVDWFREYDRQKKSPTEMNMYQKCIEQIDRYTKKAQSLGLEWSKDVGSEAESQPTQTAESPGSAIPMPGNVEL